VKLLAHRVGLPGNEISFFIVPLDSAYKARPTGHLPANSGLSIQGRSCKLISIINEYEIKALFYKTS